MNMKLKNAEYTMEKSGNSFTFSVREERDFCKVQINYISELGAKAFFETIKKFKVRACQLTAVAEDSALSAVSEIFRGLL